jgi:FtsZ-interacting cell division protein ZipA
MSTVLIVIIVIVVLVVVGLQISAANRRKRTQQIGEAQVEAKRDDVGHHRERAQQAHGEEELAQERAKRAAAEAELNERKAEEREQELKRSE